MIVLEPINDDNYMEILELKADDALVSPNFYSLAEAYVSLKEVQDGELEAEYALMPFAIKNGDEYVGFAMIGLEDGEDISAGGEIYWLSRLMIDDAHQRKGYGSQALTALIDFAKSQPHGRKVNYFYTSVVPDSEGGAEKFYLDFGFENIGEKLGDEDLMKLIL